MTGVVDFDREKYFRLQSFMDQALAAGPRTPARSLDLGPAARRRLPAAALRTAAAAVLVAVLAVSLFVPALARAISAIPFAGPAYETALTRLHLDIAYAAGFIPDVQTVVHHELFQLTVLGSYADGYISAVSFRLDGDPELSPEEFAELVDHHLHPTLTARWGWCSNHLNWMTVKDELGSVVIVLKGDPLPWWAGNRMTLTLRPYSSQEVKASFPVRRLPSRHEDSAEINWSLRNGTVTLDRLVFTPACTQSYWTATVGVIPEIKILDESGAELQPLGWGGPTGRRGDYVDWRRGYEPTRQRRFAAKITGYHLQDYVETRFEPGACHDSGGLRVFVDSVVAEDQRSQVVISYEDDLGERELSNYHVYLGLGSRRTQLSTGGSVAVTPRRKKSP